MTPCSLPRFAHSSCKCTKILSRFTLCFRLIEICERIGGLSPTVCGLFLLKLQASGWEKATAYTLDLCRIGPWQNSTRSFSDTHIWVPSKVWAPVKRPDHHFTQTLFCFGSTHHNRFIFYHWHFTFPFVGNNNFSELFRSFWWWRRDASINILCSVYMCCLTVKPVSFLFFVHCRHFSSFFFLGTLMYTALLINFPDVIIFFFHF